MNNCIRNFIKDSENAFNDLKAGGIIVGTVVAISILLEKLFYLACCTITLNMIFKVFNKIIDMF